MAGAVMTALPRTLRAGEVTVGATLPEQRIVATPTRIISTAIATRDFQDVHHDRDLAVAKGSADIFFNILTDTGFVQRYVTDWAGPEALVRSVKIKLGVPCYAYDTLVLTGTVTAKRDSGRVAVAVRGAGKLGDHVTGTVEIDLPGKDVA
ncbi:MAG: MaoC family dehydratase [Sciscionella sp.]